MASRVVLHIKWKLVAGIAVMMLGCGRTTNDYVAPPPPAVTAMLPVKHPVVQFIEENGESEAVERAEVRSRVRGFIKEILFKPGQEVSRDTVLYEIEDDEYVAAQNASEAEVAAAEASIKVSEAQVLTAQTEVNRAQRDFERQTTLLAQKATSKSEFDVAQAALESAHAILAGANAAVDSSTAKLKQAEANLAKATLDLEYTKVRSPIDGRITTTEIKRGNLVENGTELSAVINDEEVFVNFTISDRQLLELRQSRIERDEKPVAQQQWSSRRVFVKLETDEGFPHVGSLNYVGQEGVNAATGALPLRAVFKNPDRKLLPGLFVRVRVPVTEKPQDALLIPSRAVMRDRDTSFVMVVGDDNIVQRRDVRLGEQTAGWSVIRQGIDESEQIIIDGLQRSRPKQLVDVTKIKASAEDLPEAFKIDTSQLSLADQPSTSDAAEPPSDADSKDEESR